jgi:formylmethanofuran dehydrogenase subunit D
LLDYGFTRNDRYGSIPSVHVEGDHFHVNTANGASIVVPIHWTWDVLLVNDGLIFMPMGFQDD